MIMVKLFATTLLSLLLQGAAVMAASTSLHLRDANPWMVCGCRDCGINVWNADADGFSCGARITYLQRERGFSDSKACRTVAGSEFPTECGQCNPDTCVQLDDGALEEEEYPSPNNNDPPPVTTINTNHRCGCDMCELYAWQVDADGYSCGARIDFLLSLRNLYPTEEDACRQVAKTEFPSQCGLCNPEGLCDATATPPPPHPPQTFEPPTELYCFPPYNERTRHDKVWGKYTLEVKEGVCGPSDNLFSNNGVSLSNDKNEVTLTLGRSSNGQWYGGEVRVLLPADEYYDYGKYSFHVKSIQVVDTFTDGLVSKVLPPSVILGLFTWDDTKNYAIKENYNQEVDIELSRWNVKDNQDVQFLVQPPGNPQMYRFYSGKAPSISLPVYDQANHTYEFDWEPAEITWYSSAGGGHRFTYSSQDALAAGQPDYVQCMPARVEVRINLWNLFGTGTPTDMDETHQVQVVIDKFDFEPSGRKAVGEGGVCTRDCHCGDMLCVENRCVPSSSDKAPSSDSSSSSSGGGQSSSSDTTTIAAATSDEEQVEPSGGSTFWREYRWIILGCLMCLVALLAILACLYYRKDTRRSVIVCGGPGAKSVVTDEEAAEEDTIDSGENDPYRMATSDNGDEGAAVSSPKEVAFEDTVQLFHTYPVGDGVEEAESEESSTSPKPLPAEKRESGSGLFHFGDWISRLSEEGKQLQSKMTSLTDCSGGEAI